MTPSLEFQDVVLFLVHHAPSVIRLAIEQTHPDQRHRLKALQAELGLVGAHGAGRHAETLHELNHLQ